MTPKKSPDELKPEILAAVLAHVPFDGWSDAAITRAATDLGLDKGMIQLAFPGGPLDLIDYFSKAADDRLAKALELETPKKRKIRDLVTFAVRLRIEDNTETREAARRAVAYLALPQNAGAGLKMLYRTVDTIWHGIGDRSTDFNFYTKRATLAAVFSATLLYWLSDESEDCADSWAFLDRRIADVMKIEKLKADIRKPFNKLPDLGEILGKIRYPNIPSGKR
jgi:ubiquinone biosynthesis protein COQ9